MKEARMVAMKARFALRLATLLLTVLPLTRAQQDSQTQAPSNTGSSSGDTGSGANPLPNRPVVTSMETGQPLDTQEGGALPAGRSVSLFSLGHLSLLSVTTFYEHDSNFEFTPQPQSANALAFQGLLLYSIGNERTALDLQYRPYVFVARGTAQADLVGSAFNLHTHHYFNPQWLLELEDRFQYLPAQGRLIDPTIGPDLSSPGNIARNPFLYYGQTTLNNAVLVKMSYSTEHDVLSFQGHYQYLEAWTPSSSTDSSKPQKSSPTTFQQENTAGVGVSWTHNISTEHSFGVNYLYNRQLIASNADQFQYHSLLFNYSQLIRPSLQMVLSFGPSWQVRSKGASARNYIGSALLVKRFSSSELVLSYATNFDYIGVISNGYYTRYDAYYTVNLTPRWDVTLGAGYAQQAFNKLSSFDGREEWARTTYFLTEKLSAFVSFANFAGQGGTYPYASRSLFIVGARWAYHREHSVQP